MALKNINFALISLDFIMITQNVDYNLYMDDHTFYFYYIQNLLTACGNVANAFDNKIPYRRKPDMKSPAERSRDLRKTLELNLTEYPLVFLREARNTNMHFDERYDECNRRIGDYNIIDENTPYDERSEILNTPHLRTYVKQNQVYITVGRYGERIEFPLEQLRRELIALKNRLENYVILWEK